MTLDYYKVQLKKTAEQLSEFKKGILAVDESTKTIGKRLFDINVENTEENRQAYRGMLFTTPDLGKYISGAILYEETLYQKHVDGDSMVDKLTKQGIIPGIKVDTGLKPLVGALEHETFCSGLDGLVERASDYYERGARFAKWRAVIKIENNIPSEACIYANAHALARYAAICQENGLVPIVEPEILMDGTHDIEDSFVVTEEVLHTVFSELYKQGVQFEEMILKPNMVLSGYDADKKAGVDDVASATVQCFLRSVPAAVPGIAFLSGGQSDEDATAHLNSMNQILGENKPWNLSFSYGRALQQAALKSWQGSDENVEKAQNAFMKRAKLNSLATLGKYSTDME